LLHSRILLIIGVLISITALFLAGFLWQAHNSVIDFELKSERAEPQIHLSSPIAMASWLQRLGYRRSSEGVRLQPWKWSGEILVDKVVVILSDTVQPDFTVKGGKTGDQVVLSAGYTYDPAQKDLLVYIQNRRDSTTSDEEYLQSLEYSVLEILQRITLKGAASSEESNRIWRDTFFQKQRHLRFLSYKKHLLPIQILLVL
jgi:hypothetical protein